MLLAALCCAAADSSSKNESARARARYYFMEGARRQAMADVAASYEYYRKAYLADPSYVEAGSAYGSMRSSVMTDTMQSRAEQLRSLALAAPYVDMYPDDVNEALSYGYMAYRLDTIPEAVRVLERTYARNPKSTGALLILSEVNAARDSLKASLANLTEYERVEGHSPQLSLRKMSMLLGMQDTTAAVNEASKLIETNPFEPNYMILKGNLFDVINRRDSALYWYEQAERIAPGSGAPKLSLADYYRQEGDSAKFDEKMYEMLLCEDVDLDRKTEIVAGYLQSLLSDKHDTGRGDYLFSVLREQYPHEPKVLDLAARYSAAKRQFPEAEEQIRYALDMEPANRTFWGQLITYQLAADSTEKALATYDEAMKHVEPDNDLRHLYASVAMQAERYDLAIATYRSMAAGVDSALRTDTLITLRDVRPDISLADLDRLSQLFTAMGDTWHLAEQKDSAYMAYENAIALDESNYLAKNNYAYFLSIDGGDLEKARKLSAQTITGENAENATNLDTYAWILHLSGENQEAEKYQKMAVEAMEKQGYESPELFNHYGDILMSLGNVGDAIVYWRKALELDAETEGLEDKISEGERILEERRGDAGNEAEESEMRPVDTVKSDLEQTEDKEEQ
mgnify:FL=1